MVNYRRYQFNKVNNKDVLHKNKKRWIMISLVTLMAMSGAFGYTVSANTSVNSNIPYSIQNSQLNYLDKKSKSNSTRLNHQQASNLPRENKNFVNSYNSNIKVGRSLTSNNYKINPDLYKIENHLTSLNPGLPADGVPEIGNHHFDAVITFKDDNGPYNYAITGLLNQPIVANGYRFKVDSNDHKLMLYNNNHWEPYNKGLTEDQLIPRQYITGKTYIDPRIQLIYDDGNNKKVIDTQHSDSGLSVNSNDFTSDGKYLNISGISISGYVGEPYRIPLNDFYHSNQYPNFIPDNDNPVDNSFYVIIGKGTGDSNIYDDDNTNDNGNYWLGSSIGQNHRTYKLIARRYWRHVYFTYTDNQGHKHKYDAGLASGIEGNSIQITQLFQNTKVGQIPLTNRFTLKDHDNVGPSYAFDVPNPSNDPVEALGSDSNSSKEHPEELDVPLKPNAKFFPKFPIFLESWNNRNSTNNLTPALSTDPGSFGKLNYNQNGQKEKNLYPISMTSLEYNNKGNGSSDPIKGKFLFSEGTLQNQFQLNGNGSVQTLWPELNTRHISPGDKIPSISNTQMNFSNVGLISVPHTSTYTINGQTITLNKGQLVPVLYYDPTGNELIPIPNIDYEFRYWQPDKRDAANIDKYNKEFVLNKDIGNDDSEYGNIRNGHNIKYNAYNFASVSNDATYSNNGNMAPVGTILQFAPQPYKVGNWRMWDGKKAVLDRDFRIESLSKPGDSYYIQLIRGSDGKIHPKLLESGLGHHVSHNGNWGSNLDNQDEVDDGFDIQGYVDNNPSNVDSFIYWGLANGIKSGSNSGNGIENVKQIPEINPDRNPKDNGYGQPGFKVIYERTGVSTWLPQNAPILWDNNLGQICSYEYDKSSGNGKFYTDNNASDGLFYQHPVTFFSSKDHDPYYKSVYNENGRLTDVYMGDMNAYAQPVSYNVKYLISHNYLSLVKKGAFNEQNSYPNPIINGHYNNSWVSNPDEYGINKQHYGVNGDDINENWKWDNNNDPSDQHSLQYLAYAGDSLSYHDGAFHLYRHDYNDKNGFTSTDLLHIPNKNKHKLQYDEPYENSYLQYAHDNETTNNGNLISFNPQRPLWSLGFDNPENEAWPNDYNLNGNDDNTSVIYLADRQIKADSTIAFIDINNGQQIKDVTGNYQALYIPDKNGRVDFDESAFLDDILRSHGYGPATFDSRNNDWVVPSEAKRLFGGKQDIVRCDSPDELGLNNDTFIYVNNGPLTNGDKEKDFVQYVDVNGKPINPSHNISVKIGYNTQTLSNAINSSTKKLWNYKAYGWQEVGRLHGIYHNESDLPLLNNDNLDNDMYSRLFNDYDYVSPITIVLTKPGSSVKSTIHYVDEKGNPINNVNDVNVPVEEGKQSLHTAIDNKGDNLLYNYVYHGWREIGRINGTFGSNGIDRSYINDDLESSLFNSKKYVPYITIVLTKNNSLKDSLINVEYLDTDNHDQVIGTRTAGREFDGHPFDIDPFKDNIPAGYQLDNSAHDYWNEKRIHYPDYTDYDQTDLIYVRHIPIIDNQSKVYTLTIYYENESGQQIHSNKKETVTYHRIGNYNEATKQTTWSNWQKNGCWLPVTSPRVNGYGAPDRTVVNEPTPGVNGHNDTEVVVYPSNPVTPKTPSTPNVPNSTPSPSIPKVPNQSPQGPVTPTPRVHHHNNVHNYQKWIPRAYHFSNNHKMITVKRVRSHRNFKHIIHRHHFGIIMYRHYGNRYVRRQGKSKLPQTNEPIVHGGIWATVLAGVATAMSMLGLDIDMSKGHHK